MRKIVLLAVLALGAGCTQTQVAQTQTAVTTVCAAAPALSTGASAAVQADLKVACADEQAVEPVVAPLIPAPAAK